MQTGTITNEKTELMVMNSAGATLPNTGGSGTTLRYLLGIMIICLASACLITRNLAGKG